MRAALGGPRRARGRRRPARGAGSCRCPRATARSARGRPARCARRRPRTRSRRGCGARWRPTSCACTTSRSSRLRSGALVALEALLRWEDPVHGMVSPAEFIPRGRADRADRRARRLGAGRRLRPADRRGPPAGLRPHISFNVSPQPAAPRRLPRPRARRGSARPAPTRRGSPSSSPSRRRSRTRRWPRRSCASCTRSGCRSRSTTSAPATRRCRGCASCRSSTLKIDRAFMRDVPERPEAAAVVTAILQLAARARPHRRGRGRGDRGAARVPGARGLPARAGLPARRAGAARGVEACMAPAAVS